MKILTVALAYILMITAPAAALDTLFHIYSRAESPSVVSQALAGAGTALPLCGFQALINPALGTKLGGANGTLVAGYGRSEMFNRIILPLGMVLNEEGGVMGGYYRYLRSGNGSVHDIAVNFAGRASDSPDDQGPLEFGLNIRYEHSNMRRTIAASASNDQHGEDVRRNVALRSRSLLFDIGFFQSNALLGADYSLVFPNIAGYQWTDINGKENGGGWLGGRHRTVIAGMVYPIRISNGILLQIPFDLEIANLFVRTTPNRYIFRTGAQTTIGQNLCIRFGYAHAPENPLDLVTEFNRKNLFFGGIGVDVKPVRLDFFAGKDEFGGTVTYSY